MIFIAIFTILILNEVCYGDYEIKEKLVPSYLNMTFYDLPETIFPYDIKMSMSLSRVTGTLLYSIDSNDNQLIVNLNDVDQPSLNIEFSKQHSHVSLLDLCGCKRCRFENITLRIQMRDSIYLQCNEGKTEVLKYERTKMFNKDYPVPNFNKTDKLKAHLWLVNTPYFEDLYPNNDQLYGCIFDVWYNNKIIKMDSHKVVNKCRKTCTPGICHSGECLETYNKYPVCNCTASFNNGRFCNDTIGEQNYNVSQKFQYKCIKFSFSNLSNNFFELKNDRVSLKVIAKGTYLFFVMNCIKPNILKIESTISQKYKMEDFNIVILEFEERFVDIKFSNNGLTWIYINVPHYHDISRTIFDVMTVQSDQGIIDIQYKNDLKESKWHEVAFHRENYIPINVTSKLFTDDKNENTSNNNLKDRLIERFSVLENKVLLMFGMLFIFIMVIAIFEVYILFILIKKQYRRDLKITRNVKDEIQSIIEASIHSSFENSKTSSLSSTQSDKKYLLTDP